MNVTVRLFAGLKQLVGGQEIALELGEGATVGDLDARLGEEYPQLKPLLPGLAVAVAEEYRARDFVLHDGDEVALIPPISGGDGVEVTEKPLDPAPLIEAIRHRGSGAVVVFLGVIRGEDQGRAVRHLEYDAYRSMAEKELRKIADEVRSRWPSTRAAISHRTGRVAVGETALIVAVSAPHRQDAFEACRYVVDRIKEIVPIWKKEVWEDGEAWLEGHKVDAGDR